MDRYIYLLGSLLFLAVAAALCMLRRDLLRLALYAGTLGGAVALITEPIFTRDYWHPPTLLNTRPTEIEELIFGFAITALIAVVYPVIARRTYQAAFPKKNNKVVLVFFMGWLLPTIVATFVYKVNSVLVMNIVLFGSAIAVWVQRRDLFRPSILTACVVVALMIGIYAVLFDVLSPHWWDRYWLLAHTRLGITFLGHIPVMEVAWYAGWSLFAGVVYPYFRGKKLVPLPPK